MTLEKLKDLLMSLYAELQDVKNNSEPDDDDMFDLLVFMDSELVDAGKIVGQLIESESIIKAAIRYCDHKILCIQEYHKLEDPKHVLLAMIDLLKGKTDLDWFNNWLDECKETRDQ